MISAPWRGMHATQNSIAFVCEVEIIPHAQRKCSLQLSYRLKARWYDICTISLLVAVTGQQKEKGLDINLSLKYIGRSIVSYPFLTRRYKVVLN